MAQDEAGDDRVAGDGADGDQVDRIVAQWARERPDLDTSAMAVIGRLSRVTRALEDGIARGLSEHGLRSHEFDVLATLRRNGPPFELYPQELLDQMMVTSSTMTHRLVTLEERGLVTRRPSGTDRRRVVVTLTEDGHDLVDRAVVDHYANEHLLLATLSSSDRDRMEALLRRLALDLGV